MIDPVSFAVAVSAGMVRAGTPVLFACLGELITEQSGVLNLGVEGIMLVGALSAVLVSVCTGNVALALVAAMLCGALLAGIHAILTIRFQSNQVAAGIALTIFGTGLTAYIGAPYVGKSITALADLKVPFLSDVPIVGPILFHHDPLVYVSFALVPLVALLLYRTSFGLAVQACGKDPHAAAGAGISVKRVRYIATMIGGSLAALGGAYLSLVYAQGWIENITAGRGLVAVGLVMFSLWKPWRALLGAYLFGGALSLQLRLQAAGCDISPYLLGMVPYLLVITVLAVSAYKLKGKPLTAPESLGIPYTEQA